MNFNETNTAELDRELTPDEQKEWNSLYASYRAGSLMSGEIMGIDSYSINGGNDTKGAKGSRDSAQTLAAVIIPYRIKVIIPENLLWENPDRIAKSATRNLLGAKIDFVITEIDRENNFCIGSRVAALKIKRKKLLKSPPLAGDRIDCNVLAVGKKALLVEAGGFDLRLTQIDLNYSMMSDLRLYYATGQSLTAVVKNYDKETSRLTKISVRDAKTHPYEGVRKRHPINSRRTSIITGKYKGSIFCKLENDLDCMCNYSEFQNDEDFDIGSRVVIVIKAFDDNKKRVYGVIVSKWK